MWAQVRDYIGLGICQEKTWIPPNPNLLTHQSRCCGVTVSSVALMQFLWVRGRDCKTPGESQPETETLRGLCNPLPQPRPWLSSANPGPQKHLPVGLTEQEVPGPSTGEHQTEQQAPKASLPCHPSQRESPSPVSSSRKARHCLASRGSSTQWPVPAAHSKRRLWPARPSSMPLRSCRGMARVGSSQLAGGPLWREQSSQD